MPTEFLNKFGTATALTITLDSLASSATAGRLSAAVDNTATLDPDAWIDLTLVVGSGTIANDKCAYVYMAQSVDGTSYTDAVAAGDAAYTQRDPTNLRFVGAIAIPTQSLTYRRSFFVPNLPPKYCLFVRNYCGIALGTGCSAQYRNVRSQST